MSSVFLYDQIYNDNIHKISSGNVEIDPYLSDPSVDRRRGISLIIPIQGIKKEYGELVSQFQTIMPEQHYYPFENLHITVFDFVQASERYAWNLESEKEFGLISHEALTAIVQFPLRLDGLVFSAAAGLIKGYDDDRLITMRGKIRNMMRIGGLKVDERYESSSAHVSFCRFASRLSDPERLVCLIDACKDLHLGTEQVTVMELVEHDWYNSQQTKRVIATFSMGCDG